MTAAKKISRKKIILAVILGFVLILVAVYTGFAIYFSNHFWLNTTINGVDCSGKDIKDVEAQITSEIDKYEIILEERNNQTDKIKSTDILLKPVFDGTLQKELTSQGGFLWITSLFKKSVIAVETMVDYEDKSFDTVIMALRCMDEVVVEKPADAYVSEYIPQTGYEVMPEVEGNLVDKEKLVQALKEAIMNLQEKVSLEQTNCYVAPKIRVDDKGLVKLAEDLNKYVKASITYEFGDQKVTLDGDTIHQWINVNQDKQVILDEAKVTEYVKTLSTEHNTAYKPKKLATSYGTTIEIPEGDYGWWIDREEETAQLLAELKEGKTVSREPAYKQRASSFGANDYGNTYVEINLTAQHLFFYKDGSLLVEADFVSGNVAKGHHTPSGAFGISYTQQGAVLRGEDYETPVDFWMPFNGDIGMHDATWRSDYGGNYYKNSGSHGCINLPYSAAKKIFENIKTGDAVFVYELPGTESTKSASQDKAAAVTAAIGAIGDVTLDSQPVITSARSQYDGLDEQAKSYVRNYEVLVNAEAAFANLTLAQQAQNQAKLEADGVIGAIAAIKTVTAESKEAISNARSSYDALSDLAKSMVSNYDVLLAAEQAVAQLKD